MMCLQNGPYTKGRREYKDPRYPPIYIYCHLCNTIAVCKSVLKIRQLYQLLCPVRLQILVSQSTLLCTILFHSNLSRIVILGNMFLVPSIVTSRRCSDYLNHALKTRVA